MPTPEAGGATLGAERWNHNIHYGLGLLRGIPAGAVDALDVGCGEGWMVRELARSVPHVVGLDPDEASLALARRSGQPPGVEYTRGELLACDLAPASFDLITCIAALHHTDEEAGLRRMADLLRPGGTLAVVGLASSRFPRDVGWQLAGAVATRVHKLTKSHWETPAPKAWPPPRSYPEMRRLAATVLPGSTFARKPMWRYALTWTKPTA